MSAHRGRPPRPWRRWPGPLSVPFGKAVLGQEGVALVLTLQASKAALRLEPWDGGTFSARLAPADRYTAVAANLGPSPMAFARFQIDKDARLSVLRLIFDDGQAYDFTRE